MADRVWTIRGVSDRTREAVAETAHGEGLTIGEWVDHALARAAAEARHPKPPAATRADVAELVREQLAPIVARLASLEEKVDRRTGPTSARTGTRGQHPRGPRLRLPDK